MKNTKINLDSWSREYFGDIFKQLIIIDEFVRINEELFEENPTTSNRMILQKAQDKLKKYIHFEEEFWRQKIGIQWYS